MYYVDPLHTHKNTKTPRILATFLRVTHIQKRNQNTQLEKSDFEMTTPGPVSVPKL